MNDRASYIVLNISDVNPSWCSVTRCSSQPAHSLQQLEQGESHMGNTSRSTQICKCRKLWGSDPEVPSIRASTGPLQSHLKDLIL